MNGRWPANVILSTDMAEVLDQQSGNRKSGWRDSDIPNNPDSVTGNFGAGKVTGAHYSDEGGASRFFLNAGYEPWEIEWIYSAGLRPCGMEEA